MSLSDFGEIPFGLWGILFPISGIFTIRYRSSMGIRSRDSIRMADSMVELPGDSTNRVV
jgi:hypothetical protein